jgi:hypothetical protein
VRGGGTSWLSDINAESEENRENIEAKKRSSIEVK